MLLELLPGWTPERVLDEDLRCMVTVSLHLHAEHATSSTHRVEEVLCIRAEDFILDDQRAGQDRLRNRLVVLGMVQAERELTDGG